jgi:hypothetical protein
MRQQIERGSKRDRHPSFGASRLKALAAGAFATALLIRSATAAADGGYAPPVVVQQDSSAFVEMVDQRALLRVLDDRAELWLQDRYRASVEEFGWVIPIPSMPQVDCEEDPVLDGLDHETAPLFVERYWSCGWRTRWRSGRWERRNAWTGP